MKKEKKRYFLVEYYDSIRSKTVSTYEEVLEFLHEIEKYNNRKRSKYIFGNVEITKLEDSYLMQAHIYRKYTNRLTISEIDNLTSSLDEKELALMFSEKSKMINGAEPDINIAYFETQDRDKDGKVKYEKGIKYIPVLYKDDLKYLDKRFIKECLYFHASTRDFDFFRDLANEFSFYHFVGDEIGKLRSINDKCENQDCDLNGLYLAASRLYEKFICEYEKDESLSRDREGKYIISRRRLRDFGFFIKNYNIRDSKRKSPLCYNKPLPKPEYIEEESGQLKLILK